MQPLVMLRTTQLLTPYRKTLMAETLLEWPLRAISLRRGRMTLAFRMPTPSNNLVVVAKPCRHTLRALESPSATGSKTSQSTRMTNCNTQMPLTRNPAIKWLLKRSLRWLRRTVGRASIRMRTCTAKRSRTKLAEMHLQARLKRKRIPSSGLRTKAMINLFTPTISSAKTTLQAFRNPP